MGVLPGDTGTHTGDRNSHSGPTTQAEVDVGFAVAFHGLTGSKSRECRLIDWMNQVICILYVYIVVVME